LVFGVGKYALPARTGVLHPLVPAESGGPCVRSFGFAGEAGLKDFEISVFINGKLREALSQLGAMRHKPKPKSMRIGIVGVSFSSCVEWS
jgi:hypothetical protein